MSLPVKFPAELQAGIRGTVFFADVSDNRKRLQALGFRRPRRCITRIEQDIRAEPDSLSEKIGLCNAFRRAVYNGGKAGKVGSVC